MSIKLNTYQNTGECRNCNRCSVFLISYVPIAFYFFLCGFLYSSIAISQIPLNDNCSDALSINIANTGWGLGTFYSDTVDITNATLESGEFIDDNHTAKSKSVWFTFTLPTTREVSITLMQPAPAVLSSSDAGWSIYKTNSCLPDSSSLLDPIILNIEGYNHECLKAGTYLIQVSGKVLFTSPQNLFIKLEISNSAATETNYDFAEDPYDFSIISGYTLSPSTLNKYYDVGCQSIFKDENQCPDSSFTQSTWHLFTTDNQVDYVRFEISESPWNSNDTTDRKWGYVLYEGNASSDSVPDNGPGLTTIDACNTLTVSNYGTYASTLYPCQLSPNTTYSIQLFHPTTYSGRVNVRMYEMGVQSTSSPNPLALDMANQLGVLANASSYTVKDYFSCNGFTKDYTCGSLVTDSILISGSYYDMNTWLTFEIAQNSNVTFSLSELASQPNPYVRIFKGDVMTDGCLLTQDTSFVNNYLGYNCMEAGKYSIQILGQYLPQAWPASSSNLGKGFNFTIKATQLAQEDFGLFSATEYEQANSSLALSPGIKYTLSADTFDCRSTLLPGGSTCNSNNDRAMYRVITTSIDGIITIGGGKYGVFKYKLYNGDASALPIVNDSISGLNDLACCQDLWASFKVCAVAGTYTLVTFGDKNDVNLKDQPWVRLDTFSTTYTTPASPEIMDTLSSVNATITASNAYFFCTNNPDTILSYAPCYTATKLIYREFYLYDPSALTFTNKGIEFQNTDGNVYHRLFYGRISTGGLTSLIKDCFKSFDLGICDTLSVGWYTVVSYDVGETMDEPEYCTGRGASIGDLTAFQISIKTQVDTPLYNTFAKAEMVNGGSAIFWEPNGSHTVKIPKNDKTYYLGTDYFDCNDDLPFPTGISACDTSYNRTSYRIFKLSKPSYIDIYNLSTSSNKHLCRLYEGDITINPPPYTIIQDCIYDDIRLCLDTGSYTLVVFSNDNHYNTYLTPIIYIDSLGYSKFDNAANAYDFGGIPNDGVTYYGNLSDLNDSLGRSPSNDFFFCTTDFASSDPLHVGQYGDTTYNALPNSTNPRRNLWYTFTATGAGTIKVITYKLTSGKSNQPQFAIYKSSNPAFPPADSTLAMGLDLVTTNVYKNNYANIYRDPCSASSTDRYYVLVDHNKYNQPNVQVEISITYDSSSSGLVKFDHYSQANYINNNPTVSCSAPYAIDTISMGAYTGCEGDLSCATQDVTDQNTCGSNTIWYTFTTDISGKIRLNYTRNTSSTTTYNSSDIILFQSLVSGDSTSGGLTEMPLTKVSKSGYPGSDLNVSTSYSWGEGCIAPGQYYMMFTGCNFSTETVIPRVWLTEEGGDYCNTAVQLNIDTAGIYSESMLIDCFTIGEAPGEDGSNMGCLGSPEGKKSGWFQVNLSGSTKLDIDIDIDEFTNYTGSNFTYRIASGSCNSLTYDNCVSDGLYLQLNLKCRLSGTFWIQVIMPDDATDSIQLSLTTNNSIDTSCIPVDLEKPKADFDINGGCTNEAVLFTNNSTQGDSVTYYWDFGDGYTSNLFEPQHSYSISGTYLIMLAVSSNSKSDTLYQYNTVNEVPGSFFTVSPTTSIFAGENITFTNSTTNANSSATYYWNFCSGSSCSASLTTYSGLSPPDILYTTAGLKTVCLTVNNGTCDSTYCEDIFVYPFSIYTGGSYDGSSNDYMTNNCSNNSINIFAGGPYDGNSSYFITGACSNPQLNIFAGGFFDGFDHSILICDTLFETNEDSLFCDSCLNVGGPFDGFAVAFLEGNCNINTLNIYGGGFYDGNGFEEIPEITTTSFMVAGDTICIGTSANLIASANTNWYKDVSSVYYTLLASNQLNYFTDTFNTSGSFTYYVDNPYGCEKIPSKVFVYDTLKTVDFVVNDICEGNASYFSNQTLVTGSTSVSFGSSADITSLGTSGSAPNVGQITFSSAATLNFSKLYDGIHDQQNAWTSNNSGSGTQWSQWYYPTAKSVQRIIFWNRNDCCEEKTPEKARLYYSNGSSWILIKTFNNPTDSFDSGVILETTNIFAKKWKLELDVSVANAPQWGEFQVYDAEQTIGGDIYWDFDDGTNSTSSAVTHSYMTDGTYQVKLTVSATNICSTSVIKPLIVFPKPEINLPDDTAMCYGSPINISVSNIYNQYQWSTGDNSNEITVTSPDIYSVSVTDSNNCNSIDTIEVINVATTGINLGNDTILCYGDSILLNAYIGNADYLWQNNNDTAYQISVNKSGTYIVTATFSNGCSSNDTIIIQVLDSLQIQYSVIEPTCSKNNGNAIVVVEGGIGNYTYLWNDSLNQTGDTAKLLFSGNYTVIVYDSMGCFASQNITLIDQLGVTSKISDSSNISCAGFNDGSAVVTFFGGVAPYTYLWSDSLVQTDSNAINLSKGKYYVTISDSNGCTSIDSVNIQEPDAIVLSIGKTDATCGLNDGQAIVSVMGGNGGNSFIWDDPLSQTNDTAVNLGQGVYLVKMLDKNGCSDSIVVEINQTSGLLVDIMDSSSVTCLGYNNGWAIVNVAGGTQPYTYLWNDPLSQKDSIAVNLVPDVYNVLVNDKNGCNAVASVNITEPPKLETSISKISDEYCSQQKGSLYATVKGGVMPYIYQWDDLFTSINDTIIGLSSGLYSVLVTDSNGCMDSLSAEIFDTVYFAVNIIDSSNVSCEGFSNGSAMAQIKGGISPYIIQWNDSLFQASDTAINLKSGTYKIFVTDSFGCVVSDSVKINQPTPIEMNYTSFNSHCGKNDGWAYINVTGGTSPYTYQWNDSLLQQNDTALFLNKGDYQVRVVDNNNCSDSMTLTIVQESDFNAIITDSSDVSCNGFSDGTATVTPIGGTAPYTYLWNDPLLQTDSMAIDLGGGNFMVLVTDSNYCTVSKSVNIQEPFPIVLSASSSDAICGLSNGIATVVINGGLDPFQILWNDSLQQITEIAYNLKEGNYTVKVTDQNACIDSTTVNINGLGGIDIFVSDMSCFGYFNGVATVIPLSGTPPYTYLWSDSLSQTDSMATGLKNGSYEVLVTDSLGCTATQNITIDQPDSIYFDFKSQNTSCKGTDGYILAVANGGTPPLSCYINSVPFNSGDTLNSLIPGKYAFLITDSNSCNFYDTIVIEQLSYPQVSLTETQKITCYELYDGVVTASVFGGLEPYSYLWNDPMNQKDSIATNLGEGTWQVIVSDKAGCSDTSEITIFQPDTLKITSTSWVANCGMNDGKASVFVSGGTPPYSYLWSDSLSQTSDTAFNLGAFNYTVLVNDINGCSKETSVNIQDTGNLSISIYDIKEVSCYGYNDGQVTILLAGGTYPYTYLWNDPSNQTDSVAKKLPIGNYKVTATDINGCLVDTFVEISQPDSLDAELMAIDEFCGQGNGKAYVSTSGGTFPYNYLWDDLLTQTADTAINLISGVYTVTITDNKNCMKIDSVYVDFSSNIIAYISDSSEVSCFGISDGSATVEVLNGLTPYTFLWDDKLAQTNATAFNLNSGNYNVIVSDKNGCNDTVKITINQPDSLSLQFNKQDASCGLNDGWASVNVSGGKGPYKYLWSDLLGQKNDTAFSLTANNYIATITDNNKCTISDSIIINEVSSVIAAITDFENISCYGNNTGKVTVAASGGTSPYYYFWNDALKQTDSVAFNLYVGDYTVIVSDNKGCTDTASITLTQSDSISVTIYDGTTECGENEGLAVFSAVGGVYPYSYFFDGISIITSDSVKNLSLGTYTLTVLDSFNCQKEVKVNVNTLLPPELKLPFNDTVVCQGDSLQLIADGANTYSWTPGFLFNNPNISNPILKPQSDITIFIEATANNGCSSNDSIAVSVLRLSIPAIQFQNTCEEEFAWFNINYQADSYLWDFGDGYYSSDTSPLHQYFEFGGYPITLTVTDSNCIETISDSIVIYPLPEIYFNALPENGCVPLEVNFVDSSTFGNQYFWNFGDGDTSELINPLHLYKQSGVFTITLAITSDMGCKDTVISNDLIHIYEAPVADFYPEPSEASILEPLIHFIDNSQNSFSLIWHFGDGDTSNQVNAMHWYNDTGTYQIMLIVEDIYGCTDTSYSNVIINPHDALMVPNSFTPDGNGINDYFFPQGIVIEDVQEFDFYIFDRWGNIIFKSNTVSNQWDGFVENGHYQAQLGIYAWKINIVNKFGGKESYMGNVNLIR